MNTAKGFVLGVIITLIAVWLFRGCGINPVKPDQTTIVTISDTSQQQVTGTGTSQPEVTKKTPHNFNPDKPDTMWLPGKDVPVYIYEPDTTKCCENYRDLYAEFTTQTELKDTIWLDSSHTKGYALLTDTLAANTLIGRGYQYMWYNTVITNTTTITKNKKPGLQVLLGGGVSGTRIDPLKLAEVEALIRGKKGGALGLSFKYDLNTTEKIYGFKKFWLISFRKK